MPLPERITAILREHFAENDYLETWISREDVRSIRHFLEREAAQQLDPRKVLDDITAGLTAPTVKKCKRILAAQWLLVICPQTS